ncbi:isocitrate/isopropylmalate dehydrogenase family protein [Halomonas daqingensis]|uniref:Isocitrate/isopropylmalate dehydrogenase family protein n=1 Tax=Billgrantia desiderata TaxID=52021 RepID=A0ABS9B9J4_9GAMM|nr:isocitrate/isopropylmalate family dehydrogenase [Halomonas desiderata]MCE8030432.1 isocitrate/isopropylmalate dehydrogenase family protein [Halomonas desiderata]MCE8044091.1 isocitrate/isopropylmalate dehydrogenase family protein [Halomonas desiderata]MCE8048665.1 isocitrate/isopropylmalate dehydrogenase family protein [Halomonas desiderata]OUE40552.1 3-isopropylmalate dehydrogenase [Halomonas desiderata SP1]
MTQAHLTLGVLNGDDIGHEIVPAAVEVAQAAAERCGLVIDWRHMPLGRKALDEFGTTMPDGTLETLSTFDGFILGPIGHREYPKVEGAINPHPILRKHFDLFANVRPTRSYPDIGCIYDDIDLVIVRENNEGFQPDRNVVAGSGEFRPTEDVTISVRVITREGSRKVATAALELARARNKRLTVVHKNTVYKLGCGMFVEECYKAAEAYPDVKVDEAIVDTFAMHLIRNPQQYDVVVTTNMFGDILTDEAAGLVGGLGMAPGLCIGRGNMAMAQATHGSAPDIAGTGLANPYAMIESTRMLIEWLGRRHELPGAQAAAALMAKGIQAALADPRTRTPDIRGQGRLSDMVNGMLAAIKQEMTHA